MNTNSNHLLTAAIVGVFEGFLESKNIQVPCADSEEEAARNGACLYGMEYWDLVDQVEHILDMFI